MTAPERPSKEVMTAIRQHASRVNALHRKLERSARETPAPGFERTIYHEYWRSSLIDEFARASREAMAAIPTLSECGAILHVLAGVFGTARRFDAAQSTWDELLALDPSREASILQLVAYLHAWRGDLAAARATAARLHALPERQAFHRIDDADLERSWRAANP